MLASRTGETKEPVFVEPMFGLFFAENLLLESLSLSPFFVSLSLTLSVTLSRLLLSVPQSVLVCSF